MEDEDRKESFRVQPINYLSYWISDELIYHVGDMDMRKNSAYKSRKIHIRLLFGLKMMQTF